MDTVKADYLIVGSGAMGMAFADTIVAETDATLVIVDRHHQPGGHWNDAYPYVRLHQPSAFYGVNSKHLGSDAIDATGWNKGLFELATNSEVCAYFDQVMQQTLLPTGRVQHFPMCEYDGDGHFTSSVSGNSVEVQAAKVVDATYMNVTVPSMCEPTYTVEDGVHCQPPNFLPRVAGQYQNYVIVGAGKTAMDACLFLLKNNVEPKTIQWIMPRDSWLLDRANIQPLPGSLGEGFRKQAQAIAGAQTLEEMFARFNASGSLLRFDETVTPTMYRCATVTEAELTQLRRITNVIRLGHVQSISTDQITLEQGTITTNSNTLHVDCTADGLAQRPVVPIFDGDKLTLQSVRTCQQVFSAAFIGHIEAAYTDEIEKNELCGVVPHPDSDIDFLRTTLTAGANAARWAQDPGLVSWLKKSRLDGFSGIDDSANEVDQAEFEQFGALQQQSTSTLERLLAEIDQLTT